jgi:hypothetical protein
MRRQNRRLGAREQRPLEDEPSTDNHDSGSYAAIQRSDSSIVRTDEIGGASGKAKKLIQSPDRALVVLLGRIFCWEVVARWTR